MTSHGVLQIPTSQAYCRSLKIKVKSVWNHFQYFSLSCQSPSGQACGISDGYWLGRGTARPGCQCTTTAAGALLVIV